MQKKSPLKSEISLLKKEDQVDFRQFRDSRPAIKLKNA